MYERSQTGVLSGRLAEPRRFIQILFGRDVEVDYIVVGGPTIRAVEVKSGVASGAHEGLLAFKDSFGAAVRTELVGSGSTSLEEFLSQPL